jgi:hypothetical protein
MYQNKKHNDDILMVQIYVGDIIYGSTCTNMTVKFTDLMKSEFEMSMVGELNYFLRLQVKQQSDGIFISQTKYALNLIKRFSFENGKNFLYSYEYNSKTLKRLYR